MPYTEDNNNIDFTPARGQAVSMALHDTAWHKSLTFKFSIIIITLLGILMGMSAYFNYRNDINKLNAQLLAKGESVARLTALAAVEGVLAFDSKELDKLMLYLNKEDDIVYAVIYSAKNENLTSFVDTSKPIIKKAISWVGSNKIKDIAAFLKTSKSIEGIKYPVIYGEFNLGYIEIGMSRDSVIEKTSRLLYQKLIETVLLIFILCIAIYTVFRISTIEPILRLMQGLRRVSVGEFDYHVDIVSQNEFGNLARSFNTMVDELQQVHKEKDSALLQLEDLNNELALDVEARSHALTEVNKELEYIAMHDSLTQLPNRNSFFIEIDTAIKKAKRNKTMVGLIMMDLDSFKEINETKGHDIGDEILIAIANRLKKSIRGNDCVGRLGGDEFVVLIDNVSEQHLKLVAKKVMSEIEPAVIIAEEKYYISASMGLALYPNHAQTPNDLLRCADIAMYKSKERKDDFTIYNSTLEITRTRHIDLLGGLKEALQSDQLFLEYQPKIDINQGIVSGVEALVRWQHPERGIIPPYEFISLAENTGLIKPLTSWVLNEAIKQNALWNEQGLKLSVSVNLSTINLEEESLPEYIQSLLDKYKLPAGQLILEVTETTIMVNPNLALGILTKLHEMGIYISIDDFGTGYSSLAYLHKLPVDEVKIDRSFVLMLNEADMNKSIVRSIIELGHNLLLSVVAEGVEDLETVLLLARLKCDVIQGFYFSKPLSAAGVSQFCQEPVAHESFLNVSSFNA